MGSFLMQCQGCKFWERETLYLIGTYWDIIKPKNSDRIKDTKKSKFGECKNSHVICDFEMNGNEILNYDNNCVIYSNEYVTGESFGCIHFKPNID